MTGLVEKSKDRLSKWTSRAHLSLTGHCDCGKRITPLSKFRAGRELAEEGVFQSAPLLAVLLSHTSVLVGLGTGVDTLKTNKAANVSP